ncbi:transcription termination factor MTERF15, mitochondrial-like [Carex rostrata]
MSMYPFLVRIHSLCPSLPLNRSTSLTASTAPTQASPPNPHFAVEYLVQSCGLSSDEALKASKYIPHLKSPEKPNAVLCFLRDTGVNELDIRTAVSRDARILCSNVEKNWKPNIAKLQEVGFSIEDISGIIASSPSLFRFNCASKIEFWIGVLGSVENLYVVLKTRDGALISSSLEKVILPRLSYLKQQCGLSNHQVARLIKSNPRLISARPDVFEKVVERALELGVAPSSGTFINALIVVSTQNKHNIDARLNNLRNLGFSQEEVELMIRKKPTVLAVPEKIVGSKMEFLMKEAGCDKLHVIQNPVLFTYSLEKRLIPRNLVRKLLMSKGLPVANLKFSTIVNPSNEKFVNKFILPYENIIPGLHQAYADAIAGKIKVVE